MSKRRIKKFPSEQVPGEYNQEVITRLSESIYSELEGTSNDLLNYTDDANARLDNLEDGLAGLKSEADQKRFKGGAGLPIPENLKVIKVPGLPIVVAWCKPLELLKYPSARGFQFFGSVEENFSPLAESATVVYTGQCKATHATEMRVTATESIKALDLYTNLPWWYDMGLNAGDIEIFNETQGTSGLITAWSGNTPLTLTTNIAWTTNDVYRFNIERPRNLIGQGPLPFCVHVLPWDDTRAVNPKYDGMQYFIKCRTKGKHGYSDLVETSVHDVSGDANTPTVDAVAKHLSNKIVVHWTSGEDPIDFALVISHFDVYRTTANTTAMVDDNTYLVSTGSKIKKYSDSVIVGDIVANKTYWYWVKSVTKDGVKSAAGVDSAKLGKPENPVIYSGVEDGQRGFGILKDWTIKWYIPDDAASSWVKRRRKFSAGVYGLWSLWKMVPFTTANGLEAGEHIQQFTFHNLLIGKTYDFGVMATNNALVPGVWSDWTTQEYTMSNSLKPSAPT